MKRLLSFIVIISLMGLVIGGCNNTTNNNSVNSAMALTNDIEFQTSNDINSISGLSIIEATDNFGLEVFKEEINQNGNENIIVSPISIFTAFNVLLNGAEGETKEQLKETLHVEGFSDKDLNNSMNDLINYLNNERVEDSGTTQIFNSIWIDNKLNVKSNYLDLAKKYYNSDIYNADFKDDSTLREMNGWINEKSNGLIKEPITELSDDLMMTIFNVLYFKGKWIDSFDKEKTQVENFYLKDGNTVNVDMMNDQRNIGYYEDDEVQLGTLDYYNGKMLILLPKGDIDEYLEKLDTEVINNYNEDLENMSVKIKLPKFDIEYKSVINDTLKILGMENSFNSDLADFSGINDDIDLYISEVLHDCVVKVDEEGTEAAALTAIMMRATSMPYLPEEVPEFYIDKPFIFIIQDNSSDLILFIGKVENPS